MSQRDYSLSPRIDQVGILDRVGRITARSIKKEAKMLGERWCLLNEKVFKRTGKMMEKYNVEDTNLESGGGEYPVQDGFGWTNGVYVAIKARLEKLG